MRKNRVINAVLLLMLLVGNVSHPVSANMLKIDASREYEYTDDGNYEVIYDKMEEETLEIKTPLQSSVDLSKNVEGEHFYMPEVEMQHGGTCAAFATTYYQYTYEVNRANEVRTQEDAKKYSPYYVYAYTHGAQNGGIQNWTAYEKLMESGTLEWDDFYNSKDNDSLFGYSTDVSAMRNALRTRLNRFFEYTEEYEEGAAYNSRDKVEVAKRLLSNGFMLSSYYNAGQICTLEVEVNGQIEEVVYRMGKGKQGYHSVAIVGYDDDFAVDINGDGKADAEGAFKVVNSWGTTWHNKGYFWVLYDALVQKEGTDWPVVTELKGNVIENVYDIQWVTEYNLNRVREDYIVWKGQKKKITTDNWKQLLNELPCIPQNSSGNYSLTGFKNMLYRYCQDWEILTSNVDKWLGNIHRVSRGENSEKKDFKELFKEYVRIHKAFPPDYDKIFAQYYGERGRMFSRDEDVNWFTFIKVKDQDVAIVGQVDYILTNRSQYAMTFYKDGNNMSFSPKPRNSTSDPIEAPEVFDISRLVNDVKDMAGEQIWKVKVTLKNGNTAEKFQFKLTDRYGHDIKGKCLTTNPTWKVTKESDGSETRTAELLYKTNLQGGDLNCDGYIEKEEIIELLDMCKGSTGSQPLANLMADVNMDGKVDTQDARELLYRAYRKVCCGEENGVKMSIDDLRHLLCDFGYGMQGDLDLNHEWTNKDYEAFCLIKANGTEDKIQQILSDINLDGKIDESDKNVLADRVFYRDIDFDGKYTDDDIYEVYDYLRGFGGLEGKREIRADIDGNGYITSEDMYMLMYGYYLNMDNNSGLNRERFYGDLLPTMGGFHIGDMNGTNSITEYDLMMFTETLGGKIHSYSHLILSDVNRDLKLDEQDRIIYENEYMSDIPFDYTLDDSTKTMTVTGMRDKNQQYIEIAESYCVNKTRYTVTTLGENAFDGCRNLDAIYFPATLTKLEVESRSKIHNPYRGIENPGYVRVYFAGDQEDMYYMVYSYAYSARLKVSFNYKIRNVEDCFKYEADHEKKTIKITGALLKTGAGSYDYGSLLDIHDRYLVNGEAYRVTEVADYAFFEDQYISEIYLPACLERLDDLAFGYIPWLFNVDMTRCRSLTYIDWTVFQNDKWLETVRIPANVERIKTGGCADYSPFNGCNPDRLVIEVDGSGPKEGWEIYWNYIDENTQAQTVYLK